MNNALLARFIPEARELVQSSASCLLKLERSPTDTAAINEVFRAVHTLKGSSGLFDVVPLTRLVHAAEDLLGEVRAQEREVDSDLVDLLFDSLDQVSAWIDHLERHECLPPDADQIGGAATGRLRATGTPNAGTDRAIEVGQDRATRVEWVGELIESDRLDVFGRACTGQPVLAVRYTPDEGCFYNGEDPFNLVLQVPGLAALQIAVRQPWPPLADLDPYRCNLEFRLLSTGPRVEVEHLFRYVSEQVCIDQIAPEVLIGLSGTHLSAPVYDDFIEQANAFVKAADWRSLHDAAVALQAFTNSESATASALRWLVAVLRSPFPNAGYAGAMVKAMAAGAQPDFVCGGDLAVRPVLVEVKSGSVAHAEETDERAALLHKILAAQRRVLAAAKDTEQVRQRVPAVARVLMNMFKAPDCADRRHRIQEIATSAEADGAVEGMLALIDSLDSRIDRPHSSDVATEPNRHSLSGSPTKATLQPLERVPADADAAGKTQAGREERPGATRTLKVDQAKVDLLMNLIGELVVCKNSLPFLAKRAENVHGSREMAREIKDQFAVFDRLSQEMQGAIMQVRMLPVSEVFDRFPRLVRDLARKLAKKIELAIEGEETAADKTIIEALGDPLLHIVRNSIDHGIETPAERVAAGKPEQACIRLKASQESDHVVIEVSDDGRGVDPDKVRAAAVAKGVIDADKAAQLSREEAIDLIFRPGFSTAAEISDLSGRGVGLDVVRTSIEKLSGRVELSSQLGMGTSLKIALPLSMAVTRVMVVEATGELYGIPMDIIAETVRVPRSRVQMIKQAPTFVLRDTIVPLIHLGQTLGRAECSHGRDDDDRAVLVCRVGGSPIGLVVDDFREGMDVILKPFEGVLAGMRGFSGTALLGDGHVLLVLNMKDLL